MEMKKEINKIDFIQSMELHRIIGGFKTTPVEVLQKEAGILPYEHQLKYMAARKAASLYSGLNNANPVKQHLITLISASPIDKLTMMYNDNDCMMRTVHELNRTVKPDPKGDTRLQESATVLWPVKAVKQ